MKTNKTIMEEFKKDFLTGELNTDFPVVAFYDEGRDSGDYWNGYKMERWLEQALKTVEDRERERIVKTANDFFEGLVEGQAMFYSSSDANEVVRSFMKAITTNNNE